MRSKLIATAAALGTATCCPTLFLAVEKGKPAPRPWLPEPKIVNDEPIPQPAQLENRFLSDQGRATDRYPDYNDGRDLSLEARSRALIALERIKHEHGLRSHRTQESEYKWIRGTLQCERDGGTCYAIDIPEGTGGNKFYSSIEIGQTTHGRRDRVDEVDCTTSDAPGGPESKRPLIADDSEVCAHALMMARQCNSFSGDSRSTSASSIQAVSQSDEICLDVAVLLRSCMRHGLNQPNVPAPASSPSSTAFWNGASEMSSQMPSSSASDGIVSSPDQPSNETKAGSEPPLCGIAAANSTADGSHSATPAPKHRPVACLCEAVAAPFTYLPLKAGIKGKSGEEVMVRLHMYNGPQELSTPLFTFIHITDAQIRDPTVLVGGRSMSHRMDWLLQSFEYNADLEFNDRALAEAIVATINEEVQKYQRLASQVRITQGHMKQDEAVLDEYRAEQPQFVIHTGDALDSGVTSELRDFHQIIDRLNIPSYILLGSHDVMAFGNLMPTRHRHSDNECATVQSVMEGQFAFAQKQSWLVDKVLPNKLCIYADIKCDDCGSADIRFVAAGKRNEPINHTNARKSFIAAFEHRDYDDIPQPSPLPHKHPAEAWQTAQPEQTESEPKSARYDCESIAPLRPSRQHGFDLNRNPPDSGYYAFSSLINVPGENGIPRKVVSIVLNTEDFADDGRPVSAGVGGRIGKVQLEWLSDTLHCTAPRDLVLVFGHVALSEIEPADLGQDAGELLRILNGQKNIIAYFYGHGHEHEVCGDHKRPDVCSKFWEIETASLLEFPQEARRVKIKSAGDGLAFLELVAFRERLQNPTDERAKAIELARRAGERDRCYSIPSKICDHGHMQRTDGQDANTRLWFTLPSK